MTGTRAFIAPSQADFVSGCKMPSSQTIVAADTATKEAARLGSAALLRAIDSYFRRGGRG